MADFQTEIGVHGEIGVHEEVLGGAGVQDLPAVFPAVDTQMMMTMTLDVVVGVAEVIKVIG